MTQTVGPAIETEEPARDLNLIDRAALTRRASRSLSSLPRPLLRWAGSKQRLLPGIIDVLPDQFNAYYEPFLGSGALFFLLQPKQAVISDVCTPLVDFYRAVRSDPDEVYERLAEYDPLDSEMYYRVRNDSRGALATRAARFLYLNRSCWNGLYRVNKQGQFNVPYGAPKTSTLPDATWLQSCAAALSAESITIMESDFEDATSTATHGDLVFFDPPYVTGHNNNGFVDYNEVLFSWNDQERLAQTARNLRDRGVHVVVTNANHKAIWELYSSFDVAEISRMSTLASNKKFRRPVTEVLISSTLGSVS